MPPVRPTRNPAVTTVNPSQVQNNPALQNNAFVPQPAPSTSILYNPVHPSFTPSNAFTMPPKRQLKPALSNPQQSQAATSAIHLQQDLQKQVQQQQAQQLQQHQHQQAQQQQRQQGAKHPNQGPAYGTGVESTITLGELLPGVHQHANPGPGGAYQLPQYHHHGHGGYPTGMEGAGGPGMQQPPPQPQQANPVTGAQGGSSMAGKRKESISNDPEGDKIQVASTVVGGAQGQLGAAGAPPAPKRRRSTKAANATASTAGGEGSGEGAKPKARTNKPWTPQEEQRLKQMRDAGNSWGEIAKTFPTRTEGSVKKHWYKDMHYAEFGEDESAALLAAIKEYDANKWKVVGQKVGKPAKACEAYAKEHFQGKI